MTGRTVRSGNAITGTTQFSKLCRRDQQYARMGRSAGGGECIDYSQSTLCLYPKTVLWVFGTDFNAVEQLYCLRRPHLRKVVQQQTAWGSDDSHWPNARVSSELAGEGLLGSYYRGHREELADCTFKKEIRNAGFKLSPAIETNTNFCINLHAIRIFYWL
jgi:hypothetical protein